LHDYSSRAILTESPDPPASGRSKVSFIIASVSASLKDSGSLKKTFIVAISLLFLIILITADMQFFDLNEKEYSPTDNDVPPSIIPKDAFSYSGFSILSKAGFSPAAGNIARSLIDASGF